MLIENIDPVIFSLGPLQVHWYGLMMAVSFMVGSYYLLKNGKKLGLDEDALFVILAAVIICGIIGARAVYVLTNLPDFISSPGEIHRIDRGGLAFHGGLLGGLLAGWVLAGKYRLNPGVLLDLAVPGITIGYMLVRIANIFNREILGRATGFFPFEQHPAQIYGSLIGLALLLIHNYLARRNPGRPGELFWSFVLYYSLLRGVVEETFRANPLFLWSYTNEFWGAGFFTLTQLATPPLILMAWVIRKRIREQS